MGLIVACCIAGSVAAADLEILHTPTMSPGTDTAVAVSVSEDSVALWGRQVTVELAGLVMGKARTDRRGRAIVAFHVSAEIEQGLQVMTVRAAGESRSLKMPVRPSVDVVLGVDCWPCAAGEPVALRALVLERQARVPLGGQALAVRVEDDRGHPLWEGEARSDEDGLAGVSWLPPAGLTGWFRVEATGGEYTARTEVWLDDGKAPELIVELGSSAPWLTLDGTAQLRVAARYPDGRPVASGQVELVSTSLVRGREVIREAGALSLTQDRERCLRRKLIKRGQAAAYARQEFMLDGEGAGAVQVAPPAYLATLDVEHHAYLALTATVTDGSGRTGQGVLTIPVNDQELLIRGSWLGWDGQASRRQLMVSTQYPDGTPAAAEVQGALAADCWAGSAAAEADGLTRFSVPANCTGELRLTARIGEASAEWRTNVPTSYLLGGSGDGDRPFHLALDRVVLEPGEPLAVELSTPYPGGTAELMVMVEGAPIVWRDVPLDREQQRYELQIPAVWRGLTTVTARRGSRQLVQRAVIAEDAELELQVSRGEASGGGQQLEFTRAGAGGAAAVTVSRPGARLWDDGQHRWSGAIPPLAGMPPAASPGGAAGADGLEYWLASMGGPRLLPRTTTHRPRPNAQGPHLLVQFTRVFHPWFGRIPSPERDRFVVFQGALLALVLGVCWLVRRRAGARPLAIGTGAVLLIGMTIWPALPWARGPQNTIGVHGAELDEQGPRSLLSRHYPGLAPGMEAVPRFGYQDWIASSTGVILEVTRDGVRVNGEHVVTAYNYEFDRSIKRGTLITPLYDRLQAIADDHKALAARFPDQPFRGDCLMMVEDEIPFVMLREVMYTAGQAQFGDFRFTGLGIARPVAPQGPGPARHPWLYGAMLAAVLAALVMRRSPVPTYLAYGVVALYTAAHALNKIYPMATSLMSDRGAFPLEEVILGLHLPVVLVVLVAVAWETFRARRTPSLGLAGLALVVVMLSVPTGRDYRMYWEMPSISESNTGYARTVASWDRARAWEPGDGDGLERYLSRRWPAPEIELARYFPTAGHRAPVVITDGDGRGKLRVRFGSLAGAVYGVVDTGGRWGVAPPLSSGQIPAGSEAAASESVTLPYSPVRLSRRLPGNRWLGPTGAVRPWSTGFAGVGVVEPLGIGVDGGGLATLIGTTGSSSSGDAVADLLADGGSLSAELDAALATATGIKVARSGAGNRAQEPATPSPPPLRARVTMTIDAALHDDPSAVVAAIRDQEDQLQTCCQALASRGRQPEDGDVVLNLLMTRAGVVDQVEIQFGSYTIWELEGCLRRTAQRWALPPDQDDEFIPVEISLEYRFE